MRDLKKSLAKEIKNTTPNPNPNGSTPSNLEVGTEQMSKSSSQASLNSSARFDEARYFFEVSIVYYL